MRAYGDASARFSRFGLSVVFLVLFAASQTACNRSTDPPASRSPHLRSRPINVPKNSLQAEGAPLFSKLSPEESGLLFENELKPEHRKRYLENGAGVAIADYDKDGLPDIFLTSTDGPNKLFRQVGEFVFEDVTEGAGLSVSNRWTTGASFADIDNDGDLDLFVCNLESPNLLYINNGDGTFRESAEQAGLAFVGASYIGSFADFDRDGDLDIYLLTNRTFTAQEELRGRAKIRVDNGNPIVPPEYQDQFFVVEGRFTQAGKPDLLYRNNGDGTFTDVSKEAGIIGFDMGLSVTWWDFNQDSWPDIYVGNDLKTPDRLYRNNGDGTFTDVLKTLTTHTPWFSMGADAADLNNDGRFDLLVVDMSSTTHYKQKTTMGEMGRSAWFLTSGAPRQYMRNALFINTGTSRFMELAYLTGLDSTDWTWSAKLADLDNDSRVDAYFTNGMARAMTDSDWVERLAKVEQEKGEEEAARVALGIPPLVEKNLAFRNLGDLQFEDVGSEWGLDLESVSHAAAFSDLDRDGDLDIVVNNLYQPVTLYRNESTLGARALVELHGTKGNLFGYGAVVRVRTGDKLLSQELVPVSGYLASDEPILHFGLGDAQVIDELTVEWPSGIVQKFSDLPAGHHFEITEAGDPPPLPPAKIETHPDASSPLFELANRDVSLFYRHQESEYDDYEKEPLLPYKLSQFGPGLAWGDVNRDGYEDLFVGGAAGHSAALFLNSAEGSFTKVSGPWEADQQHEDMGALFFDADSNGTQDLYVASGSNEFPENSEFYQDRLYLGDGKGAFEKAPLDTLPSIGRSSGVVAASDFDRDGDLDLFVGSRSVPGRYPLAPKHTLLLNEKGKFTDVVDKLAPSLSKAGMVTGAVWSDVNDDGQSDLMLSTDWGPVRLYLNNEGKLQEHTKQAGLSEHLGWWNGIASGDIDNDGDIDFVLSNLGLNTKYHASSGHPLKLYYSDFDGSGSLDLVEAEFEGQREFPVRGKSCSSAAMPYLGKRFPTFHEFAKASLGDIYTPEALGASPFLQANFLSSAALINNGDGVFVVRALPRLAQTSPAYGVVLRDFNADGFLDAVLAQNFFGAQPETGFMDGGLGVYLQGTGDGEFTVMEPAESGLVIPQDATGVAVVDIDHDGDLDLSVSTNGSNLRMYRNKTTTRNFRVVLIGPPGNPTGVGARVMLKYDSGESRTNEVTAGGGYLSQSSPRTHFALLPKQIPSEISVLWPGGTRSGSSIPKGVSVIEVHYSDKTQ